jgi:hypothetical protein
MQGPSRGELAAVQQTADGSLLWSGGVKTVSHERSAFTSKPMEIARRSDSAITGGFRVAGARPLQYRCLRRL